MSALRPTLAALAALLLACANAATMSAFTPCNSDEECGEGQVCFPDGCGDPGDGLVVEVLPNGNTGQLAQDFELEALRPVQNIRAAEPAVVQGIMAQSSVSGPIAFSGEVRVVAVGESTLIPGRSRSVQYTVVPEQGAFQVFVPAGRYTVAATPKDPIYPPIILRDQLIDPGEAEEVELNFPALSELLQIHGRLLRRADGEIAIQNAEMQVHAVDPETGELLSQPAAASSGSITSDGAFFLWIRPREDMEQIHIVAAPKDSAAMVPSKTFEVAPSSQVGILELGEFGAEVTVTGTLLSANGQPIAGASVYIEGTAGGGGKFRSGAAATDEMGNFSLRTLPSVGNASLQLVAVPPTTSDFGQVRHPVKVPTLGGDLGAFSAPERIEVLGSLLRPDREPATSVVIEAVPVRELDGHPMPRGVTRGSTDETGRFSLRLDPGIYRLDFIPKDHYPRVSRFVTVAPAVGPGGLGFEPISLPEFTLSRGRTVTGTVTSIPRRLSQTQLPSPYASVKFFRVVKFDQQRSAVLLAEALADANGNYQVVLPTR